jgi:prephenate dehydrogenase
MKLFNKVTIIGVGLIGGSIGLGIKRKHLAGEVMGVFRRRSTLNKALKRRAIDRATMNIKDGVKDADLIIIATPVRMIPGIAREVIKHAKTGALVTDAGSTKKWIVENIEKMARRGTRASFVGSHPMAGSEHASVEFARADLMDGSPCIVTRTSKSDKDALRKISAFWKALGAKVSIMSPEEHDRRVAMISHLPHLAAFAIAGSVAEGDLAYAAEGFKDTTRVASSDPELWADIFLSNREQLISSFRTFENYCRKLIRAILKKDYAGIVALLKKAKAKRDKFINGKSA